MTALDTDLATTLTKRVMELEERIVATNKVLQDVLETFDVYGVPYGSQDLVDEIKSIVNKGDING